MLELLSKSLIIIIDIDQTAMFTKKQSSQSNFKYWNVVSNFVETDGLDVWIDFSSTKYTARAYSKWTFWHIQSHLNLQTKVHINTLNDEDGDEDDINKSKKK